LFLSLAVLTGCLSSTGSINNKANSITPIKPGSTVSLEVTSKSAEPYAVKFSSRLKPYLEASGIFEKVIYGNEKSDYTLTVELFDIVVYTFVERSFSGGAMAPGDQAKAIVSLRHRVTGDVVRSFTAEAEAASHIFFAPHEYGIDAAFAKLEEQILLGLQ
jgi:hypothetical protein